MQFPTQIKAPHYRINAVNQLSNHISSSITLMQLSMREQSFSIYNILSEKTTQFCGASHDRNLLRQKRIGKSHAWILSLFSYLQRICAIRSSTKAKIKNNQRICLQIKCVFAYLDKLLVVKRIAQAKDTSPARQRALQFTWAASLYATMFGAICRERNAGAGTTITRIIAD